MLNQPGPPTRLTCPACSRYIGTVDGGYFEAPPCQCGVQTTVRVVAKRGRSGCQPVVLRDLEMK